MIGSDFEKARLLKTYSREDLFALRHLAQYEIAAEMRRQEEANPDDEIVCIENPASFAEYIQIYAKPRDTLEDIQDERPWLADSYGNEESSLEAVKFQRRIVRDWLIVVIMLAGLVLGFCMNRSGAGPEPIEAMPDGVSWTNNLDNGCIFDHRQISGITWIIPRRNEAYYAGICGEAEMAQ